MDVDFAGERRRIERNIDFYKSRLRSCRDKYESVDIRVANRSQRGALLETPDDAPIEGKDLHERLRNLHLSHEVAKGPTGYDGLNETIRVKMDDITAQRRALMRELKQLRKIANDNSEKLARINCIITQRENIELLLRASERKLEEMAPIPQSTKKHAALEYLKMNKTYDVMMDDTE